MEEDDVSKNEVEMMIYTLMMLRRVKFWKILGKKGYDSVKNDDVEDDDVEEG